MINLLYLLVALGLVALNAFFVATEFAIVKVRMTRIEELVARGSKRASAARDVIRNLNTYLSACQLGITLASLGLGWVGEPAFAHLIEPLFTGLGAAKGVATHTVAVTLAFVLITALHVILGELVPKTIAIDRAVGTSLLVAWPIRAFYRVFFPAIWSLNELSNLVIRAIGLKPVPDGTLAHSEEELRMIVASSRRRGVLTETHARLLSRALDFTGHTVRQILVPRGDVKFLDVNRSLQENLDTAGESGHTRFPLCDGGLDQVVGVVHIRDVFLHAGALADSGDLRPLARDPLLVPESLPIERLLRLFQREHMHLAVVIDEYGGTSGVATLEDILEELIGDIQDEFDREEPKIKRLPDGRLSVDATLPVDEIHEKLGILAEIDEEVDTLGGLVFARLGRLPRIGDQVELGGRRVEVSSMKGRRILRLAVSTE